MIAIDPGVHKSGWATFDDKGELITAGHDENVIVRVWAERDGDIVVEKPQLDGRTTGAKIQDAIDLAVEVGRFAQLGIAGIQTPQPRQWKGQMKKEVTKARAERTLSTEEHARVPKLAKGKAHNMWDAIALGLWALRRK